MPSIPYFPTMPKKKYITEFKKKLEISWDEAEKWMILQLKTYIENMQFQKTLDGNMTFEKCKFPCLTDIHMYKVKTPEGFRFIDIDKIKGEMIK